MAIRFNVQFKTKKLHLQAFDDKKAVRKGMITAERSVRRPGAAGGTSFVSFSPKQGTWTKETEKEPD